MLGRLVKLVVGVLLVPLCVAATRALWHMIMAMTSVDMGVLPMPLIALLLGLFLWMVTICVLPQPARTYIFAHELSHVIWAWLTGARVYSMKVGRERGSVEVSDTNFLIMLAPYFFPLYTVVVIAVYYLLALFVDMQSFFLVWLFLIGSTYGFHLTFTISALQHHQTDVAKQGRLFSYVVILLMNLLGILLWLVAVSEATLLGMGRMLWGETLGVYGAGVGMIEQVVDKLVG